jgi:exodeoxyribonuclease VII large subunit
MQGDRAPAAIVEAMHEVYEQAECFDALVLIRGGGSQVDLDCFDTYEVASHLAQFPLPVFTGIGHERDETIADMVAHSQLKTPTAVAEFLLSGILRFEERLNQALKKLMQVSAETLYKARRTTDRLSTALHITTRERLQKESYRLDMAGKDLHSQAVNSLERAATRLSGLEYNLKTLSLNRIRSEKDKLNYLEKALTLQHPDRLLEKGYTITLHKGKIITQASTLQPGDKIETRGHHFVLSSTLDKVAKNGKY